MNDQKDPPTRPRPRNPHRRSTYRTLSKTVRITHRSRAHHAQRYARVALDPSRMVRSVRSRDRSESFVDSKNPSKTVAISPQTPTADPHNSRTRVELAL
jgi:hypothetical protein